MNETLLVSSPPPNADRTTDLVSFSGYDTSKSPILLLSILPATTHYTDTIGSHTLDTEDEDEDWIIFHQVAVIHQQEIGKGFHTGGRAILEEPQIRFPEPL